MPIKGIIFLSIIFIVIAIYFRDEIYKLTQDFFRGHNVDDEDKSNNNTNEGEDE